MFVKTSSGWKSLKNVFVKANSGWTIVKNGFVKTINGWIQFWPTSLIPQSRVTISQSTSSSTYLVTLTGTNYYWPNNPTLTYDFQWSTNNTSWLSMYTGTTPNGLSGPQSMSNPSSGSSNTVTFPISSASSFVQSDATNYYQFVVYASAGGETGSSSAVTNFVGPTTPSLTATLQSNGSIKLTPSSYGSDASFSYYRYDNSLGYYVQLSGSIDGSPQSGTNSYEVYGWTGPSQNGYQSNNSIPANATSATFYCLTQTQAFPGYPSTCSWTHASYDQSGSGTGYSTSCQISTYPSNSTCIYPLSNPGGGDTSYTADYKCTAAVIAYPNFDCFYIESQTNPNNSYTCNYASPTYPTVNGCGGRTTQNPQLGDATSIVNGTPVVTTTTVQYPICTDGSVTTDSGGNLKYNSGTYTTYYNVVVTATPQFISGDGQQTPYMDTTYYPPTQHYVNESTYYTTASASQLCNGGCGYAPTSTSSTAVNLDLSSNGTDYPGTESGCTDSSGNFNTNGTYYTVMSYNTYAYPVKNLCTNTIVAYVNPYNVVLSKTSTQSCGTCGYTCQWYCTTSTQCAGTGNCGYTTPGYNASGSGTGYSTACSYNGTATYPTCASTNCPTYYCTKEVDSYPYYNCYYTSGYSSSVSGYTCQLNSYPVVGNCTYPNNGGTLGQTQNTQVPAQNTQVPAQNTQVPAQNTQVPAQNTQSTQITGGCFVYGTQIQMADGSWQNIEDLYIGDEVMAAIVPTVPDIEDPAADYIYTWSANNIDGTTKSSAYVTNVVNRAFTSYYLINDEVKVTFEHVVPVQQDGVWRFIEVLAINVGDNIMDENLNIVPVKSKELIQDLVQTTSISMNERDIYFVKGMMAHNNAEVPK